MKAMISTRRRRLLGCLLGLGAGALCLAGPGTAQRALADPQLSITGSTGIPGGTATATFVLTGNTAGVAVGAQARINFDSDKLVLTEDSQCMLGSCLNTTDWQLIGAGSPPLPAGVFSLLVRPQTDTPFPTDCSSLAICAIGIKPGTPTGTTTLTLTNPLLVDSLGNHLPVTIDPTPGIITIAEATATFTPIPTGTATPQATATSTVVHTNTPVATSTSTVHVTTPTAIVGSPTATPTTTGGEPTLTPTGGSTTPTAAPTTPSAVPTTPTAGPTNTPASPTVTHGSPTISPTATSTNTRTPISGFGKEGDSCNIVAPGESSSGGGLALLLAPALLIWARRRRL